MAKKLDLVNTKLDDLLVRVPKGQRWKRYDRRRGIKIDHASPWKFAKRVLKKYVNKNFGDAFSFFCSKVPKHMQYVFLDEFQNYENLGWKGTLYNYYIIDKNNIIRCVKDFNKYKGPYKFVSIDAEYENVYTNRINGRIWKEPRSKANGVRVDKDKFVMEPWSWIYVKSKNNVNHRDNWDVKVVLVKGYELIFKSKKDPLFVRLKAEKEKIRKAMNREAKKQNVKDWDATLKFYSQQLENKLELAEMKELDRLKLEQRLNEEAIVRHGFDPKTSFRTSGHLRKKKNA